MTTLVPTIICYRLAPIAIGIKPLYVVTRWEPTTLVMIVIVFAISQPILSIGECEIRSRVWPSLNALFHHAGSLSTTYSMFTYLLEFPSLNMKLTKDPVGIDCSF